MVVIDLGYRSVVLPKEEALKLIDILEKAEAYEQKYWSTNERKERGMPEDQDYTYHVYPFEPSFNMKIITDSLYEMAKLAGKLEK